MKNIKKHKMKGHNYNGTCKKCGKTHLMPPRLWLGKKRSEEIKKKIRLSTLGKKNHNWKEKIKNVCLICNQIYECIPSRYKSKYCSRGCYSLSKIGIKPWNKNLTKEEHPSLMNVSKKMTGILNPRYGLKIPEEKTNNWKGDNVGYAGIHTWVKKHKPKISLCERCNKNKPYDLANISGKYKRDISDFEWLCRRCHMQKDGRINNLKRYKRK